MGDRGGWGECDGEDAGMKLRGEEERDERERGGREDRARGKEEDMRCLKKMGEWRK